VMFGGALVRKRAAVSLAGWVSSRWRVVRFRRTYRWGVDLRFWASPLFDTRRGERAVMGRRHVSMFGAVVALTATVSFTALVVPAGATSLNPVRSTGSYSCTNTPVVNHKASYAFLSPHDLTKVKVTANDTMVCTGVTAVELSESFTATGPPDKSQYPVASGTCFGCTSLPVDGKAVCKVSKVGDCAGSWKVVEDETWVLPSGFPWETYDMSHCTLGTDQETLTCMYEYKFNVPAQD
jgi:hypothetical protein